MTWHKKGLVYVPDGSSPIAKSHAQVPTPVYLEKENVIRVYHSSRDEKSRSLPFYVDLCGDTLKLVGSEVHQPVLPLGELGGFDDCGVMPSWITKVGNDYYMYYIGWNVRNTIPYHNAVGLAISRDNCQTFQKVSRGPLWDRDINEPHYSGTSCVLVDNGVFKNWYLSCTEWRPVNGKSEPRYHIKYAESEDGIKWNREGKVAIDYLSDEEAGIVKASVMKKADRFVMWFSYRKFDGYRENKEASYRIGYAESPDGITWTRYDHSHEFGLDVSEEGWDSLMVEYPHVIEHKGKLIMFYNGNGFGASGFGYAIYEK